MSLTELFNWIPYIFIIFLLIILFSVCDGSISCLFINIIEYIWKIIDKIINSGIIKF